MESGFYSENFPSFQFFFSFEEQVGEGTGVAECGVVMVNFLLTSPIGTNRYADRPCLWKKYLSFFLSFFPGQLLPGKARLA